MSSNKNADECFENRFAGGAADALNGVVGFGPLLDVLCIGRVTGCATGVDVRCCPFRD